MIGHISLGGPIYEMDLNGRKVCFEDHPQCGPMPVTAVRHEPTDLKPNDPFWVAVNDWYTFGKNADGKFVRLIET